MMFLGASEWAMHRDRQRTQAQINREERKKKIKVLMLNPAATEGEKQAAWAALERIETNGKE
jgi:hypothetical protein